MKDSLFGWSEDRVLWRTLICRGDWVSRASRVDRSLTNVRVDRRRPALVRCQHTGTISRFDPTEYSILGRHGMVARGVGEPSAFPWQAGDAFALRREPGDTTP